jgi:hypothetical protein
MTVFLFHIERSVLPLERLNIIVLKEPVFILSKTRNIWVHFDFRNIQLTVGLYMVTTRLKMVITILSSTLKLSKWRLLPDCPNKIL